MQHTCIYPYDDGPCGKPVFAEKTHGFLCIGHYRQQQENIPQRPRLQQPRWKGLSAQSDDEIVMDIIRTDAEAIRAGRIVHIYRGFPTPVVMKILEGPVVH